MNDYVFRPASAHQVPSVREMIKERIDYLRAQEIHPSWADRDYLSIFSEDYFISLAQKGHLIIAEKDARIVACAGLHEEDFPRWEKDGVPAFYLHNLCSHPLESSAGAATLRYCIDFARRKEKKALRLDCVEGNVFLETFYRKNGFSFLKKTNDNGFKCLLWEMRL